MLNVDTAALITSFCILQLLSATGFLVILLTVGLSPRVKRSFTWISFCVGWTIGSLAYNLLFFAGQQNKDSPPNQTLCLVQGALVLSVPVLQATTNLCLIIDIWVLVSRALHSPNDRTKVTLLSSVGLVIFPYIFSVSVFIGFLLFGSLNPSTIKKLPGSAYCTIQFHRIPAGLSTGLFGFFMLFAIIFKLLFGRLLFKHWVSISNLRKYVEMIIRIMLFTTINGIMVLLTIFHMVSVIKRTAVDVALAIFPMLILFMMITEKDLWQTWLFWRSKPPSTLATNGTATEIDDDREDRVVKRVETTISV
ncbi:hypothetical protein ONZ45_g7678 [Pleurotus djamor]|nr:hypothetical protein ONZ45_g7678 [Pleurotus djamor]